MRALASALKLGAALLVTVLSTLPSLANPKADAVAKNSNIQASILLDDKIKTDPALAADCLAEGKKWLDKNAADAAAARKEDPQFFKDGGWTFERKYVIRSVVAARYISIQRNDYMDTHGAHPNSDVDTILWDKGAGKRISIRPFLAETADNGPTMKAMREAILASLRVEKKKRGAGVPPRANGSRASSRACSRSARSRWRRRRKRARAPASPSTIRPTRSALMRKVNTSPSCRGKRSSRI